MSGLGTKKNISDIYIRNDSKGTSYNLGLVLQNRETLSLDAAQIDAIVDAAQNIKELSADGTIDELRNNCWLYEREFIMQILNEEQVGDFAMLRYKDEAVEYTIKMWKEGMSYNIEVEDSIAVLNQIFHYQVNKIKIQYIYQDDDEQLREMEDFWYREAYPRFLSQLMAERRRRQAEDVDDKDVFRF
ncbi:MAG: hypothetical protein FWH18_07845 [Marinilabiliaceae bacterium]|nr:hypothetical protein [Marinilabiliaceae bacterium]